MAQLLEQYTIEQIILFIVSLAFILKSAVTYWDWGKDRLKKIFDKENKTAHEFSYLNNEIENFKLNCQILENSQKEMQDALNSINHKISQLIDSDKDDIKSFITIQHHYFCYQKKWIDNYSMDCIEKRYQHYKDEGGNSFIRELMEDLRSLPKVSPTGDWK